MTAFRVTILHDACTVHDVEADTEQGAIDAAASSKGAMMPKPRAYAMTNDQKATCWDNLIVAVYNESNPPSEQ